MQTLATPSLHSNLIQDRIYIPNFLLEASDRRRYEFDSEKGMYCPVSVPLDSIFETFGDENKEGIERILNQKKQKGRNALLDFLAGISYGNGLLKNEEYSDIRSLMDKNFNGELNFLPVFKTRIKEKSSIQLENIRGVGHYFGNPLYVRDGPGKLSRDYFDSLELLERMRINEDSLTLEVDGKNIHLPKNQYGTLFSSLKGKELDETDKVYLSHLRKKLKSFKVGLKQTGGHKTPHKFISLK